MTNKRQIETSDKKGRNNPVTTLAISDPGNENWDADTTDSTEFDERWLVQMAREKERSRIQRQMQARRELERRRDEKRLQEQVEDWPF